MDIEPGFIKAKIKGKGRKKIYTVWTIDFDEKVASISEHEYWDTEKHGLDTKTFELKDLKLFITSRLTGHEPL